MGSRVILITGGSGKFGRSLASCFLKKNDTVIFTARNQDSIAAVLDAHPEGREHLVGIQADFTAEGATANLMGSLAERGFWPCCQRNRLPRPCYRRELLRPLTAWIGKAWRNIPVL